MQQRRCVAGSACHPLQRTDRPVSSHPPQAIANLLEPGEKILVGNNGIWVSAVCCGLWVGLWSMPAGRDVAWCTGKCRGSYNVYRFTRRQSTCPVVQHQAAPAAHAPLPIILPLCLAASSGCRARAWRTWLAALARRWLS